MPITNSVSRSLLAIVCLLFVLETCVSSVRIGSFNLHQYGSKKAANATVTDVVAKILNEFDLAIIQEITDVTQQAPFVLYNALNKASRSGAYTMTLSERVGRSNTKEQFIFFNRESTSGVELVRAYLYGDNDDRFERPP